MNIVYPFQGVVTEQSQLYDWMIIRFHLITVTVTILVTL